MNENEYMLFDASRKYDDGKGGECELGYHLEHVVDAGGTPDCFDIVEATTAMQARTLARETGLHLYVVNSSLSRVVGEVNGPSLENNLKINREKSNDSFEP
ncbi:hypothetical protein L1267_16780 [Pseudoalteromonas sp. OFAV1]|uniref:hypothetical protein n=1 Tax=Pseudoalteromonas sp. OFAV1 TaxID=2908892 RepID=UPI001F1F4E2D|nr:hypothetical protein [Pseudoalteromonas sp. OFAV1]MCF2902032.1 hypothetical protein [Pseudoalteromonas sp. OFAV1]